MASRTDVPGAPGVRELKFVVTDADTSTPQLHFMNTNEFPLHYYFARDVLGVDLDIAAFNRVTYFTDQRSFIVGSVLAYDNYSLPDATPGIYALEFWPTDPISARFVVPTYQQLRNAMPFAADKLAYHPSGDPQEARFIRESNAYAAGSVQTISTDELFEGVIYSPLHLGEAFGTLRAMSPGDKRSPAATDIVIYDQLPNDLPLVAGVITGAPQTPLSHVNLRAQQHGIPNAYLHDARNNAGLRPYLDQVVHLMVTPDRITIRAASQTEVDRHLAARRPRRTQYPARDLGPRAIVPLAELRWQDASAFGAKATNLAELRRAIDPAYVPDGFAIPFSFYDSFMVANGLYDMIRSEMAKPAFQDDAQRPDLLKAIRRAIKDAPLTTPMRDQLDAMHQAFPAGTTPRCRSSANNEDLIGFTGAGLYDSYTHRADEGHIEKSIKQVWASLWNLRAFDARAFYRIDHMTAAMGVLVHPNFDDEQVNGVALTRNAFFPSFEGYFINAQRGENLITNPDSDATAEEVLVIKDLNAANARIYETIYLRHSSLVPEDQTVMSRGDLLLLVRQLKVLHDHFAALYGRNADKGFAMDVEFKFDRAGVLAIKQARPWVGAI